MEITFKMTEEMLQEAFQKAIENIEIQTAGLTLNDCVEKQIAKKPIGHFCPKCSSTVVAGIDEKYCPNCGQKLDWSDENG